MYLDAALYLNDSDLEISLYVNNINKFGMLNFKKALRQIIEKSNLVIYVGDLGSRSIKNRFCSPKILEKC